MNQLKTNYQHCLTMGDWRMEGKADMASKKLVGRLYPWGSRDGLTRWSDCDCSSQRHDILHFPSNPVTASGCTVELDKAMYRIYESSSLDTSFIQWGPLRENSCPFKFVWIYVSDIRLYMCLFSRKEKVVEVNVHS